MKRCAIAFSVLLGFWVLISLFLDFRIYGDYTLLVGDRLYYADPTFREYGGSFFLTGPNNPLMDIDNSLQGYPFRTYVQSSFAKGEIPWWNPYIGMGVPFVGLGSGVFDPVAALAGILASPTKLPNFISVMGLLIASWGMFLFLGTLGASRAARLFGAVAFTFSGWTIVWLGRTNFMAEIWMPWIFWATEHLIRKPAPERIAAVGLFSALICLPAHLQTSLHIFAALGLYVLVRLFQVRPAFRGGLRITLSLALALALGIGVATIQIVPLADFLAQSDPESQSRGIQLRAPDTLTAIWYGIRGNWPIMKLVCPTALTAISPLFFGTTEHSTFWWPIVNFPETTLYVGLFPLFFALYGFSRAKRSPDLRVWLLLTAVSLGVACGLPIFNLVNYLPGFVNINNGRLRLVYRFAVATAAALGFDLFTSGPAKQPDKTRLLLGAGYAAAVLALPLAFLVILPWTNIGKIALASLSSGTILPLIRSEEVRAALVLAVSALAIAAWRLRMIGGAFFRSWAILIAFADLFLVFHTFNTLLPSSFVFPRTRVVEFLKRDSSLYRVSSSSLQLIMPPNTKLTYDIFDVDLDSVLTVKRYAALQAMFNSPASDSVRPFRFVNPASYPGVINLMNIKYLVIPGADNMPPRQTDPFRQMRQYKLVYDGEVRIYENLDMLPRAFLVTHSDVFDNPDDVLRSLMRPDFDPGRAVLLEDRTSPRLSGPPDHTGGGTAEILSLTSNQITVRADTPKPAYLVLSEVYYPGWKATVDGSARPIYVADYLFRAVYLEPGNHEIVLTFRPESYRAAIGVSGICLAALVFLAVATLIRGHFRSRANGRGEEADPD